MKNLITRLTAIFRGRSARKSLSVNPAAIKNYTSCKVNLVAGGSYELVLDADTTDLVARNYMQGIRDNDPLAELLLRFTRPGNHILDLGAHVGTFALTAAALGRKVVAVDASPIHVDLLRHSVKRNGFDQMRVVHTAIGEQAGTVRFHLAGLWGMVENDGTALPELQDSPVLEVPSIRGDKLLEQLGWKHVDLIKMDIEGSEIAALRGLQNLLERDDAPVIAYECNSLTLSQFGYKMRDLIGILEAFGYQSYRHENGRFRLSPATHFQPEFYVDLVALKPKHAKTVNLEIDPPFGTDELISRTLEEAGKSHVNYRNFIADALSRAPDQIIQDQRVQAALHSLVHDSSESVRTAASWWKSV